MPELLSQMRGLASLTFYAIKCDNKSMEVSMKKYIVVDRSEDGKVVTIESLRDQVELRPLKMDSARMLTPNQIVVLKRLDDYGQLDLVDPQMKQRYLEELRIYEVLKARINVGFTK